MDYSVSLLAQFLSGSRLGLISLVTRLAKALYGQVGDQGGQIRDQVGQGQGQELDNYAKILGISDQSGRLQSKHASGGPLLQKVQKLLINQAVVNVQYRHIYPISCSSWKNVPDHSSTVSTARDSKPKPCSIVS